MRVVSDTSPLCNLAAIGRLDLLRERYGSIHIPAAVWGELGMLKAPEPLAALLCAREDGWLLVQSISPHDRLRFAPPLDDGETEAISLAVASGADLLLIDELPGRAAARSRNLTISGLLGELLHAKLGGRIPSLRHEIALLRTKAGFFIKADLERFLLVEAGEAP